MPDMPDRQNRTTLRAGALIAVFAGCSILGHGSWADDYAGIARSVALGAALIALCLIDLESLRLPDWLTLPLLVAGLLLAGPFTPEGLAWRAVAALAGYLAFVAIERAFLAARGYPGLGRGDAKLLAAGGAWVGLEALPSVVLAASGLALLGAALAVLAGKTINATTRVPFGPFLAVGIWLVWHVGPLV